MVEIIPGIYQLQLPLAGSYQEYVNVYLVKGDDGYLLVDTGRNTEEGFNSLKQQLANLQVNLTEIYQIVVTHSHSDHCGLAGRLKQLSQAKLALYYLEKDVIELRYINMDRLHQQMRHLLHINGVAANELPKLQVTSHGMGRFVAPISPDVTLHGAETISTGSFNFKVLWTPGHSPGHICLYESTKKTLISGDHILPMITPNISLRPQSGSNPLGDYLNSLDQLKQLDVNLILPGHEHPFTGLQRRVEELILHHEQRKSEILATITAKPKTACQIATEITWMPDIGGVSWDNLAPLDRRLALLETLAHLESMRVDGKVDKFSRDSIVYYQHT